jgi:hypothetical protein
MNKHVGEEYDEILEVPAVVEVEQMDAMGNSIRNAIRNIIIEAQKEGEEQENYVKVVIDATPPYAVILVSLSDLMEREEKIILELPEEFNKNNEESQE